jgi:hypothetical protein
MKRGGLVFLPIFVLLCPLSLSAGDSPHVFGVGEKIKYEVRAAGFFMGNQTIELQSAKSLDGHEVFLLYGHTDSSRFMDLFYEVDDKWLVFIDKQRLIPLRVEKDMLEGKRKSYLVYHIHQDEKRVVFDNTTDGTSQEKEAQNLVFDVFSLAYYYRQYPERFDSVFTFDFLEERGLQTVRFKNEGAVQITVPSISQNHKLPALKMKQVGGIGIEIYVSDDELRIPLKIVTPARLKKGRTLTVEMNLEKYLAGEGSGEVPWPYSSLSF